MKTLLDGKGDLNSLSNTVRAKLGEFFECLKDIPLIHVLKLIDNVKAHKICSTLDKIVSSHVSQSMGNYFARDDSLDPALSTVCEGLRGSTDFEYILKTRGGTFQSLASVYYHLKSTGDQDVTGKTHLRGGGYRQANPRRRLPTRRGICWFFSSEA